MKFLKVFDNFYGQSIYMTDQKVDIFQDLGKVIRNLKMSFYVSTMFYFFFIEVRIEKI